MVETRHVLVGYVRDDNRNPRTAEYDEAQAARGFALGRELAKQCSADLWIAVPTLESFGRSRQYEPAFGRHIRAELAKHQQVRDPQFGVMYLASPISREWPPRGVALALHPTRQVMDALHRELDNIPALAVVPGASQDIQPWIDTWGPEQLVGNTVDVMTRREVTDPAIIEAIDRSLHMASGLSHPGDSKTADKLFAKLRNSGKHIDRAAIRAHVLRTTEFDPETAEKLAAIAEGKSRR